MAKKKTINTPYDQYAHDIVDGVIVGGEYIQLACERYIRDRERKDLYFDEAKVKRVLDFKTHFKHWKGAIAGRPFVIEPWQQWIDANIFGFTWKDTGKRRFGLSYTQMARKNGKSFWAASSCMVAFRIDGEAGAEVIFAANSKKQAEIAFSMASHMSRQYAKYKPKGTVRVLKNEITHPESDSNIIVVPADANLLDGYGPSWVTLDEYHAAPDNSVFEVLQTGMGYRELGGHAHMAVITTAGFNRFGPCYEMRNTCIDVLRGNKEDDNLFAAIYELDPDDDWKDEETWIKANPNLGVTVSKEFLRKQITKAINTPSSEVSTKTKNLDMWVDAASVWIGSDIVKRCMRPVDWSEFDKCDVMIGTDLAVTTDLTAICVMKRETDGTMVFKVKYYLPEVHGNRVHELLFADWVRQGYICETPGNVTDYDWITNDLVKLNRSARVQSVAYDDYNATQWAISATEAGLPLISFPQTIGVLNRPTKELERLMLSGRVIFDYNPVTEFCFKNVIIKEDHNENQRPIKAQKENKIDGVVAALMALGSWLKDPVYGGVSI